jgi:WD40 repeat protein/tetratricopeptide (TPR) repeat protein
VVWDLKTDRLRFHLPASTSDASFPADGKFLVAARESKVLLLDARSGEEQQTVATLEGKVRAVAVAPDGKALAAVDGKGGLHAWEWPEGKERFTILNRWTAFGRLAFTDDGSALCFGQNLEHRLNATTGKDLVPSQYQNTRASWSADGKRVLLASYQDVSLFDVAAQKILSTIARNSVAGNWSLSRDDRHVVCHLGSQVVVYDPTISEVVASWNARKDMLRVSEQLVLSDGLMTDPGLFDLVTGQSKGTLSVPNPGEQGPGGPPASNPRMALAPDGRTLAYIDASPGRFLVLWDLRENRQRQVFPLPPHVSFSHLAFAEDGKSLLAIAQERILRCDLETGRSRLILLPGAERLQFGPPVAGRDGRTLVRAGLVRDPGREANSKTLVQVFDLESGRSREVVRIEENVSATKLALSPDGKKIAGWFTHASPGGGAAGEVRIWEMETGKQTQSFKAAPGYYSPLRFTSDSQELVVGPAPDVVVWDVKTGEQRAVLKGLPVGAVASPDGKYVALVQDGIVRLREIETGKESANLHVMDRYFGILPPQFSDDGASVLVSSPTNGATLVWEWRTGLLRFPGTRVSGIAHVAASPDGRLLALGRRPLTTLVPAPLTLLDLDTGAEVGAGLWHFGSVHAAWSPDGKRLACAGERGLQVRVWERATGKVRLLAGHTSGTLFVAFSPDGKLLASSGFDRTVRLWDASTGESKGVLKHPRAPGLVAFRRDGKTLAAIGWDRDEKTKQLQADVKVWTAEGKEESSYSFAIPPNQNFAFSAEELLLATTEEKAARLVCRDVRTGKELWATNGEPEKPVGGDLAFSPDGTTVALLTPDGVRRFDARTGRQQSPDDKQGRVGATVLAQEATLEYMPDGKSLMVAVALPDGLLLRRWAADGNELPAYQNRPAPPVRAHRSPIQRAILTPDGKRLITMCHAQVNLWDITAGEGGALQVRGRATLSPSQAQSARYLSLVACPPGGKVLAAAATKTGGTTLSLWDLETFAERALEVPGNHVSTLAFFPDGHGLLGAVQRTDQGKLECFLCLWDVASGRLERAIPTGNAQVQKIEFVANGKTFATCDSAGTARLWDVATWQERAVLTGPPGLAAARLAPDARTAFALLPSRPPIEKAAFVRWDLETGKAIEQHDDLKSGDHLSPDGKFALTTRRDDGIKLVDSVTLAERAAIPAPPTSNKVIFSDDGGRMAVLVNPGFVTTPQGLASQGMQVQIWDVQQRQRTAQTSWHLPPEVMVYFNPGGSQFALVGDDKPGGFGGNFGFNGVQGGPPQEPRDRFVRLHDSDTGKTRYTLSHTHTVRGVAFSSLGKILATGGSEAARLWDTTSGKELRTLARIPGKMVEPVAFLLDDTVLVVRPTVSLDRSQLSREVKADDLQLWDVGQNRLLHVLRGTRSLAVPSPDRRILATVFTEGADDKGFAIKVWDAATGQERVHLRGHWSPITRLWFAPDGKTLFSANEQESLFRWQTSWPVYPRQYYQRGQAILWKLHRQSEQNRLGGNNYGFYGGPLPRENFATGVLTQASASFRTALTHDPDYQPALEALGATLERLSAEAKAEERPALRTELLAVFRRLAKVAPQQAGPHRKLGDLLAQEDPASAIECYRAAIGCDPDSADDRACLAALFMQLDRGEEAMAECRAALAKRPDHFAANHHLGRLLLANGKVKDAIVHLRRAADRKDAQPWELLPVLAVLGEALESDDQIEDAIKTYRKVFEAPASGLNNPAGLRRVPHRLARLLGALGRWGEAAAVLQSRPAWLAPMTDPAERFDLAHALRRSGQMVESLATYRQAAEMGGDAATPWLRELPRLRALEKRLPALLEGKEKPATPEAAVELAYLCCFKDQLPAAVRFFTQAFDAKPELADQRWQRCHAASAAVCAAAGKNGSDEERTRWRKQALAWLTDDLQRLQQRLGDNAGYVAALSEVHHWQHGLDLSGVRDAFALARLPEPERGEWTKLWGEFEKMRQKALRASYGRWRIEGTELVQEGAEGDALLMFGKPEWKDYVIEVEAKVEKGSEVNLCFRAAGNDDLHIAIFGGWNNTYHGVLTRRPGDLLWRYPAGGTGLSGSVTAGQWQRLRAEIRGQRFWFSLDGKPINGEAGWTLPNLPVRGAVGLRTYLTTARFRNLRVTAPDGTVLFEGLPPLK